jgi:hypothetical protein
MESRPRECIRRDAAMPVYEQSEVRIHYEEATLLDELA